MFLQGKGTATQLGASVYHGAAIDRSSGAAPSDHTPDYQMRHCTPPTTAPRYSAGLMAAFKGEGEWPRHEFLYWTDDGNVAALRYDNWKITFLRQNAHRLHVWLSPSEQLRAPMLANPRMDPAASKPFARAP